MLYFGEREIFGLNVEAVYEAPFVKRWLDTPSFAKAISDEKVSAEVKCSRKLNLARWAVGWTLAREIRIIDNAIQIHAYPFPRADICSNRFLQSEFVM